MVIRLSDNSGLVKAPRLPDQVARLLAEEMASGALSPGDLLPPETALARRFGVSRAVIREALAQLKYDGLVDSRQGRGVTVVGLDGRRSFRLQDLADSDPAALAQVYELRTILESQAAALAALRWEAADLAALEQACREMALAVDRDEDGSAPDGDFHQAIAAASHNPHLADLMRYLNDRLTVVIRRARDNSALKPGQPQSVQGEHEAILLAIRLRDPHAARRAARNHLSGAANRLGLDIPEVG